MKALRSLCLALALLAGAPALMPVDAVAADVFTEGGLVELLPAGVIVGDGTRKALLHVVARNPDGSPMTGLVLKVSATTGTVGAFEALSDGLYAFEFTPAATSEATKVTLTAKGKTVSLRGVVDVVPPPSLTVSVTPKQLLLGKDTEATVVLAGPGDAGVLTRASTGELGKPTRLPNGQWSAKLAAPRVNIPQPAILAVVDAAQGTSSHLVVPLSGSVDYPVKGAAGSKITLEVAGRTFGPVTADADGKGKVPIEVPPGIQDGVQITVVDGKETRKTLDLRIPETKRVVLFPLPASLPADPGLVVPVSAVVLDAKGAPETTTAPKIEVSAGTVTAPEHAGDGVWVAKWTPPADAGKATVTLDGGSEVQRDSLDVTLVAGRPASLTLTPSPASIDGTTKVVDLTTAGLGGGELALSVEGGSVQGDPTDAGAGEVKARVLPQGNGPLRVQAWVKSAASSAEPRAVVVIPERTVAPNDGTTKIDLLVATIDGNGLPVAGRDVALAVEGGGSVAAKVKTGDDGIIRIPYTTGTDAGLVRFRATSGGAAGAGALVLAGEGVDAAVLPASGDEAVASLVQRWIDATPSLTVPRGGAAAAAAVPPPAPKPEVALVDLSPSEGATPGSTVTVTVTRVLDLEGQPVAAYVPDLVPSTGTLGEATVGPDGTVTIPWELPDDAPAEAELRAMSGGNEVGKLALPVEGGVVADAGDSPWGTVAPEEPVPEPEPVAAEPEPEPEPVASGEDDFRWFRARISGVGSTYRYEQSPSDQPGQLLPSTLAVGGPSGGTPAAPLGGEVDFRAWGDGVEVPYVGVHGSFRFTGYSIEASAFNGVAQDMLYNAELDLIGRYPFDAAGDRYWVGGKLGYHYNDFLLFTGCLDPGCDVNFEPIGVSGLGVGAELGAEIGDLFLIGGYTLGLAAGSEPYSNAVDVDLGYGFLDFLFADLGFSVMSRSVVLEGETSGLERGAINDSQMMVKLGAGVAF